MFEKFTERARKVMGLSRQEAQRLNSEFIGTEHILLGIIQEGGGVAAKVVKNLGVDLKRVRQEIEKLITPSTSPTVTLGQLPFSPRAKNVIQFAEEEAYRLYKVVDAIGTEHLLLGILREGEGIAAQVLENLGLKTDDVRRKVLDVLGVDGKEDKVTSQTHMRVKLFERVEKTPEKGSYMILKGEPWRQTGTVTLSGVAKEKQLEVAAAVAEKHGALLYTVELGDPE